MGQRIEIRERERERERERDRKRERGYRNEKREESGNRLEKGRGDIHGEDSQKGRGKRSAMSQFEKWALFAVDSGQRADTLRRWRRGGPTADRRGWAVRQRADLCTAAASYGAAPHSTRPSAQLSRCRAKWIHISYVYLCSERECSTLSEMSAALLKAASAQRP